MYSCVTTVNIWHFVHLNKNLLFQKAIVSKSDCKGSIHCISPQCGVSVMIDLKLP